MSNKQGKRCSQEFKRDAVALARSSSKTVTGPAPHSRPARHRLLSALLGRLVPGSTLALGGLAAPTPAAVRSLHQAWHRRTGQHAAFVHAPSLRSWLRGLSPHPVRLEPLTGEFPDETRPLLGDQAVAGVGAAAARLHPRLPLRPCRGQPVPAPQSTPPQCDSGCTDPARLAIAGVYRDHADQ